MRCPLRHKCFSVKIMRTTTRTRSVGRNCIDRSEIKTVITANYAEHMKKIHKTPVHSFSTPPVPHYNPNPLPYTAVTQHQATNPNPHCVNSQAFSASTSMIRCKSRSCCAMALAPCTPMLVYPPHSDSSSDDRKRSALRIIQVTSWAPLKHLRRVCRSLCSWCNTCTGTLQFLHSSSAMRSPSEYW